jgi:quercetin dioxygenase-like cupin family protein
MLKRVLVSAVLLVGTASSLAFAAKATSVPATFVPSAEVKWTDVPNAPGLQMAAVEGDPSKGASHFFLKFAPGFDVPAHHHSADHYGAVVSGTLVLTSDGKENRLAPGSFFTFNHKAKHATKCEAGADCILFIDARAKWDAVFDDKAAKPM